MKTKKSILIALPETPYPIRAHGLSIRYLPIITHLSKHYCVDLLIISQYSPDIGLVRDLESIVNRVYSYETSTFESVGWFVRLVTRIKFFLPWTLPRSWVRYGMKSTIQRVAGDLATRNYDILICVTGYMYPYVKSVEAQKRVTDFVDSPYLLSKRNVIGSSRNYMIRKWESFKTLYWEAKITRNSDTVLYISNIDASTIPRVFVGKTSRFTIPNGLFVEDFSTEMNKDICFPSIGFFGNMSYYPNIEAVNFLVDSVFDKLLIQFPGLKLYIIGRDPDSSVGKLHNGKDIIVTGEVDSIWPYLNAIDIFVFPLLRGAGLKNKVVEAMYAGKPVVSSDIGNEGLDAINGVQIVICGSVEDYVIGISKLIEDSVMRETLGSAGRSLVISKFGWDGIFEKFDNILALDKGYRVSA